MMIKNIPDIPIEVEKDFDFAPEEILRKDADCYILQINKTTKYFADYCGTSDTIETSIIIDNKKISYFTKIIG